MGDKIKPYHVALCILLRAQVCKVTHETCALTVSLEWASSHRLCPAAGGHQRQAAHQRPPGPHRRSQRAPVPRPGSFPAPAQGQPSFQALTSFVNI